MNQYLKMGWAVFPVAGPVYADNKDDYKTWKAPLVRWQEFQNRLPTPEELLAWKKRWPLAWIGCTTGPFSNLFVIDIDGEKGKASLANLKITMPITRIAQTQRGFHYYFRWNKELEKYTTTKAGVKPGIDIRGDGGFVILPCSADRKWVCTEMIAELPSAWYPHFIKQSANLPKNWRKGVIAELSEGNRHQSFLRLGGSLINAKWSRDEMLAFFHPFAVQHGFEGDLEALVDDIVNRYSKERRLVIMQEKTREAFATIPDEQWDLAKKSHPDLVHELFVAQGHYDKEAVLWCSSDRIWEGSEAERALGAWMKCVEKIKSSCAIC